MSQVTIRFIFSSLVYLALGVILGVLFFAFPVTRPLYTVHAHLNLVGFVLFMLFGVAYHILPRFRGRPLFSERLADAHFWTAQASFVLFLIFMAVRAFQPFEGIALVLSFVGAAMVLSMFMFIYNMWATLS